METKEELVKEYIKTKTGFPLTEKLVKDTFIAGIDHSEEWTDFSKEEPGEEYMFTDLLLRVDVCGEIFHEVNQYVSTPELDINPHWERKIFGKIVAWRPINRK